MRHEKMEGNAAWNRHWKKINILNIMYNKINFKKSEINKIM